MPNLPHEFYVWFAWYTNPYKAMIPRPAVPAKIPQVWWDAAKALEKQFNIAHATPPNKPPIYQVTDLPMLFTAWGFDAGKDFGVFAGVQGLALHAKDAGFKSIALQWGTAGATYSIADTLHLHGFNVCIWGTVADYNQPANIIKLGTEIRASRIIAQVEGTEQSSWAYKLYAQMPVDALDLVTDYSGLEGDKKDPIKEAHTGMTLVECYAPYDPNHAALDTVLATGYNYGLKNLVPTIGLFGGVGLAAYPQLKNYGKNYAVWLAELMRAQDWLDVGNYNRATK